MRRAPTDGLNLRKACLPDAQAIADLVNAAYSGREGERGWTSEAEIFNGNRIDMDEVAALLVDPRVIFLAHLEDGGIAGCVYVCIKGMSAYLGLLAVRPDLQAKGLRKRLVAEADRVARAMLCDKVEITVMTSHRPELTQFYERRGYARTGRFRKPLRKTATLDAKVEGLRLEWMEKQLRC